MTTTTNEAFEDTLSSRDDEYVPVGLDGILSATQKALAMNRGLVGSDHRDGLGFKRLMSTADLMAERVRMDATGSLRKLVQHSARQRTLKGFSPGALDDLIEKHITQSSLSSPLEEINPLDVMNQARRVTMLGPGGISSADMITPAMQAVHASSFGYLSAIEGPECFDARTQVYTRRGWKKWNTVTLKDTLACQIQGKTAWCKPDRLIAEDYEGLMIVGETGSLRMCVTANHRVVHVTLDGKHCAASAVAVFGKEIFIPVGTSKTMKMSVGLKASNWSKIQYAGKVYCATVPGGLLLVRGAPGTIGFWSGNSSSAGVDTRLSNGTKLGSNGRIYQKFRNPRTGDIHWLAPEDLQGKVVGLPR